MLLEAGVYDSIASLDETVITSDMYLLEEGNHSYELFSLNHLEHHCAADVFVNIRETIPTLKATVENYLTQTVRIMLVVTCVFDYYTFYKKKERIFKATMLVSLGFCIYFSLCCYLYINWSVKHF